MISCPEEYRSNIVGLKIHPQLFSSRMTNKRRRIISNHEVYKHSLVTLTVNSNNNDAYFSVYYRRANYY